MSQPFRVLGIDPGFAAVGVAVLELGSSPARDRLVDLHLLTTTKATKTRGVRASDDNLLRARILSRDLGALMDKHQVRLVCAETMSFPRSASVAAKMAMCWGVLASLTEARSIPLAQATPKEIKDSLCGRKDASKDDIQSALRLLFPDRLDVCLEGIVASKREHPCDALAAIRACQAGEVFGVLRRMVGCEASTASSSPAT